MMIINCLDTYKHDLYFDPEWYTSTLIHSNTHGGVFNHKICISYNLRPSLFKIKRVVE